MIVNRGCSSRTLELINDVGAKQILRNLPRKIIQFYVPFKLAEKICEC